MSPPIVIAPVNVPPDKGIFELSVAVTFVILLPSPYNVSAYMFLNLVPVCPISYVESTPT